MPNWKGIIGRGFRAAEFKEYVATLRFTDWRPQFAVVHNTSAPRLSQWHSHPGEVRMRNLESYYRNEQHWSAGPHLFVADDLIWVFTPLTTSGVHSPSWNGVAWGIELVGEYDEEPFNPAVRENAVDALAALYACRGLAPATIRFHKEDPGTTHTDCPGRNVNKADLIARVEARMNSGVAGEHVPTDDYLEIGATNTGVGANGPEVYTLRSPLLAADPTLAEIAAGDLVLRQPNPSRRIPGIGTIQQAINRLAKAAGKPEPIDLGEDNKNLGFYGPQTLRAIEDIQRSVGVTADGVVGDDTLKAIDAALVAAGLDGLSSSTQEAPAEAYLKTRVRVLNRGIPSTGFLQELVAWGKSASDPIFADQPDNNKDVFASVITELGPFKDITHRKACMLEVMRVLAGFESSWNWNEGIDTNNPAEDSPGTISAGAFQVSANSMGLGKDLKPLVAAHGIHEPERDGKAFQTLMKKNHPLTMEYVARLMRHTRMHHGPLYKGKERAKFSPKLQGAEQSIYPWLSRDAVAEFQKLLA
jgi:peptidoglycan hydrolase-like protein with peptidoglycan-binding domain